MQGINIIGVQFRRAGKVYDFAAGDLEVSVGDQVIVDSDRGPSLAEVVSIRFHNPAQHLDKKLKPILRKASSRELAKPTRLSPEEVTSFTSEQVTKHKLSMRVLKSEVQFGGSKVIVYFSAPGRVDFRELVKDLAGGLRTRVELKQVGARDETKLLGGMGICGREYCCSSFLREFVPVSIRMAKNQNLALNPSKVSGGCGRLLCCLTYENDTYTHLRQMLPPRGALVRILSENFTGKVVKTDLLNQLVVVEDSQGTIVQVKAHEIEVLDKHTFSTEDSSSEASDDLGEADLAASEWADALDLDALSQHLGDSDPSRAQGKPRAQHSQPKGGRHARDSSSQKRQPTPRPPKK